MPNKSLDASGGSNDNSNFEVRISKFWPRRRVNSTVGCFVPLMRNRVPLLARLPIAVVASLILTGGQAWLFDHLPTSVVSHFPSPVMYALHLPGSLYCWHLIATEPLPDDDVPLFQAGQLAQCYFVTLALDVPYYLLLILIGWWLVDRWRAKRTVVAQPT
jgi:hypothetical protein